MVNASYDASGSLVAVYDQAAFDSTGGEEGSIIFNNGDMAYIMLCAVLVMIMSPGVGYLCAFGDLGRLLAFSRAVG